LQLIGAVRNSGLGREGIDTGMMMQLVDCTIDTSSFLRRERDVCLFEARSWFELHKEKRKESVINKEIN